MSTCQSLRLSLGSSGREMVVGSGGGLAQPFSPTEPPIREDSKELMTRATTTTTDLRRLQSPAPSHDDDDEEEYVIRTSEQRITIPYRSADETTRTGVPDADAAGSELQDEGLSASQATVSTQFSRKFVYADGDGEAGEVQTHSAWSLERMRREKPRVDALLAETLRTSAVDGRRLQEGEKDDARTAEMLHRAAEELSNYSMKIAIRSVGDDDQAPSETVIRAAAVVTVHLLNLALSNELGQFPAASSNCGQYQIQRAAVVVGRVLHEAASRVSEDKQQPWSEKALQASDVNQ